MGGETKVIKGSLISLKRLSGQVCSALLFLLSDLAPCLVLHVPFQANSVLGQGQGQAWVPTSDSSTQELSRGGSQTSHSFLSVGLHSLDSGLRDYGILMCVLELGLVFAYGQESL